MFAAQAETNAKRTQICLEIKQKLTGFVIIADLASGNFYYFAHLLGDVHVLAGGLRERNTGLARARLNSCATSNER